MTYSATRREVLTGAALAAASGAVSGTAGALSTVAVRRPIGSEGADTLVVVFLRGGADGLNMVVPYAEDEYHKLRPGLGMAAPNDLRASAKIRCIDLNGFFGLHPSLAGLVPAYHSGQLAIAHAVGSLDQTRSHFEAMATMERGIAADTGPASGWLARHLLSTDEHDPLPLRAVALGDTLPDSLRGAQSAAFASISDFRLRVPQSKGVPNMLQARATSQVTDALSALYADGGSLRSAGLQTIKALDTVKALDPANYRPAPGVRYPTGQVGYGLRQTACMIKGQIGLEVACLDSGGWDTHVAQGRDGGLQASRMRELGDAIGAFYADLSGHLGRVTLVAMTEFGRRAYENSGLGTDHGRGSCMFVLGDGVRGGRMYAQWPGLARHQLEGPGDLRVTTDYRSILADVLRCRLGNRNLAAVFPDYTPAPTGMFPNPLPAPAAT